MSAIAARNEAGKRLATVERTTAVWSELATLLLFLVPQWPRSNGFRQSAHNPVAQTLPQLLRFLEASTFDARLRDLCAEYRNGASHYAFDHRSALIKVQKYADYQHTMSAQQLKHAQVALTRAQERARLAEVSDDQAQSQQAPEPQSEQAHEQQAAA